MRTFFYTFILLSLIGEQTSVKIFERNAPSFCAVSGSMNKGKCITCQAAERQHGRYCRKCALLRRGKGNDIASRIARRNFVRDGVGILTGQRGEEWIIDAEDFDKCKFYLWQGRRENPRNNIGQLSQLLLPNSRYVEHLNGNRFDFRKINLADCVPRTPEAVGDYFTIATTSGDTIKVCACHVCLVSNFRWCASGNPKYACAWSGGETVRMHHLIYGEKRELDHINRDSLDNRCFNLRPCTHAQNTINISSRKDNTSGHRGVNLAQNGKWRSRIQFEGKRLFIGDFSDKATAALAYNEKARELFGEFAVFNQVNT